MTHKVLLNRKVRKFAFQTSDKLLITKLKLLEITYLGEFSKRLIKNLKTDKIYLMNNEPYVITNLSGSYRKNFLLNF